MARATDSIDGHHGTSSTFDPAATTLDQGNGDPVTATARTGARPGPSLGAVFEVAGSSAPVGSGSLEHPVMVHGLLELGSCGHPSH